MNLFTGTWIGIGVVIGAVAATVILLFWFRSKRSKNLTSNVIPFQAKRKSGNVIPLQAKRKAQESTDAQPCSRCRKRRKLTYYASDAGTISGLCTDCRKELERHQELYPL